MRRWALAVAAALLATGPARATRPGAYVDYGFAEAGPFDSFSISVRWDAAPDAGTIYQAFQFWFEVGQGGYMGTQVVGTRHVAIFSVWDLSDAGAPTAVPTGSCDRFGGEGTGARCLVDYPWVVGREYTLRVALQADDPAAPDRQTWAGSITDTVTGAETPIGRIQLLDSASRHGYGRLRASSASVFLEYFAGADQCTDQPYCRVRWRGPEANGGLFVATHAIASYPACGTDDVCSPGPRMVQIEGGGAVAQAVPAATDVWWDARGDCAADGGSGQPPPPPTCGCSAGGLPAALACALACLLRVRRRLRQVSRRDAGTRAPRVGRAAGSVVLES